MVILTQVAALVALSAFSCVCLGNKSPESLVDNLEETINLEYAVDTIVKSDVFGHLSLQMPYAFKDQKRLDESERKLLLEQFMEHLHLVRRIINERLSPNTELSSLDSLVSEAKEATFLVAKHASQRESMRKIPYEKEFLENARSLFAKMLEISVPVAEFYAKEQTEDPEEVLEYCNEVLDQIEEGLSASPTAYFINWENTRIGDVSLYEIGLDMMARLRVLRLSPLLVILHKTIEYAGKSV